MPNGPGTYGPSRGGSGLAAQALSQQGIPQGVVPAGAPDPAAMSEIIQQLRAGQVGGERFLMLLSLLAGSTLPGMQAGPQQASPQGQDIAALLGA